MCWLRMVKTTSADISTQLADSYLHPLLMWNFDSRIVASHVKDLHLFLTPTTTLKVLFALFILCSINDLLVKNDGHNMPMIILGTNNTTDDTSGGAYLMQQPKSTQMYVFF